MRRKRFSEEQIIRILGEHESGRKVSELCRKPYFETVFLTGKLTEEEVSLRHKACFPLMKISPVRFQSTLAF